MKCEASQELVVGGFTDPQGARVGLGALLVGYYEGDDFVFAGKIGTGFDTKLLLDLAQRLDAIEIADVAVHERRRACRDCARTGCGRRSSCRSASSSGRCTASCAIRDCSASASTRTPRDVVREAAVITHPEKVLFPDDGITKGELAAYYEAIAPVMLPHLRGRPVTMERYPAGIGKKGFWQKDVSKGFPAWLEACRGAEERRHRPSSRRQRRRARCCGSTNQNTITQHVWTSRAPELYYPDICVFDLDPSKDDPAATARRRARSARSAGGARPALLDQDIRVEGLPHRSCRSTARRTWIKWRASPTRSARLLVKLAPDQLTQEFSKVDRGGRIYVDTGRNGYSATFAAAYTVRAKRGAPVSAPCTWEEVEQGQVAPAHLHAANHARAHRQDGRRMG